MKFFWILLFLFKYSHKSSGDGNIQPNLVLREPLHHIPQDFAEGGKFSPFDHCETGISPRAIIDDIPEYEIDLALHPRDRWKDLVSDKKTEILTLIDSIKNNCDALFGHSVFWMVEKFMPRLAQTLPAEYREEILGISDVTGISVGEITLFNVFYEFFSACTSIVANSKDNVIYHGRNLDFGLFLGWNPVNHTWQTTGLLKPLVVQLRFKQGNTTLYRAVNYAGYTGIMTAFRPGKFALTINERFRINGGYIGIAQWILGLRNQQWIGYFTRQVMERCNSYSCAQKFLSKFPLIAPVYFILSGSSPSEGCVITRSRKNFNVWPLGHKQKNQTGNWFLVQTNYDQWQSPPIYDDRRNPAIVCMDQLGNKDMARTLTNVLSTRPVLNKLTTYTAVMSAEKNLLKVWIQSCPDPCWPW